MLFYRNATVCVLSVVNATVLVSPMTASIPMDKAVRELKYWRNESLSLRLASKSSRTPTRRHRLSYFMTLTHRHPLAILERLRTPVVALALCTPSIHGLSLSRQKV